MRYKRAYSGADALSDLMAVGSAANRGAASGALRHVQNMSEQQHEALGAATAAAEKVRADRIAAAEKLRADYLAHVAAHGRSPERDSQYEADIQALRATLDVGQAHHLAAEQARVMAEKADAMLPHALAASHTANAITASRLMPHAALSRPSQLGRAAATAIATGGLQHAALSGFERAYPDAPIYGSALASAGGALAGRALVRAYEAHEREQAQKELMAPSHKTAGFSTGFWERIALIKVAKAPVSLEPLAWSESGVPSEVPVVDERPALHQALSVGADVLKEMASDPNALDAPVPPPENRMAKDEVL